MANFISGVVAVLLIIVFLGSYAIGLRSIPFAIIVVAIIPLILFDFVQSVRKDREKNQAQG